MGNRAIRTKADYEGALRETSGLMEVDPGHASPDGARLDLLADMVQAYETKHYSISKPVHGDKTKIQK